MYRYVTAFQKDIVYIYSRRKTPCAVSSICCVSSFETFLFACAVVYFEYYYNTTAQCTWYTQCGRQQQHHHHQVILVLKKTDFHNVLKKFLPVDNFFRSRSRRVIRQFFNYYSPYIRRTRTIVLTLYLE